MTDHGEMLDTAGAWVLGALDEDEAWRFSAHLEVCAACRDEWTGVKTLNENSVPENLTALHVELVGNYAVHFTFSDQHATGIYSFKILRELCPCCS